MKKIVANYIILFVGIKNKHAFLDLLLLAQQDGKKIDAESVREEVDTFMFEVRFNCLNSFRDFILDY